MNISLIKTKFTILISIWFLISSIAIFGLASTSKSEFDPNLTLSQGLMSLTFENRLEFALSKVSGPLDTPAIFHITQGECYCEFLAKAHQSELNKWSSDKGFKNFTVDISQLPDLVEFIPSTPAIVVIDEYGSILYLGPYSRGAGCFSRNGQVDNLLFDYVNKQADKKNSQRAIIETEASGCYCAT